MTPLLMYCIYTVGPEHKHRALMFNTVIFTTRACAPMGHFIMLQNLYDTVIDNSTTVVAQRV